MVRHEIDLLVEGQASEQAGNALVIS
jgi:hypothetical protein